MTTNTDDIYARDNPHLVDFAFDQRVVDVFPDMIRRSVPAYETVVPLSALVAARHVPNNGVIYDLGCSRGATTAALLTYCDPSIRVVGIDNSQPMIDAARNQMSALTSANDAARVEWRCADITETPIAAASAVVMNYTLQFITPEQREVLLRRIASNLEPGAPLIYAEKVVLDDPQKQAWADSIHLEFKRANGYSELEVAQKRSAIEKVMIPDTLDTHLTRLKQVGLVNSTIWFSCLNWAAFIAFAPEPAVPTTVPAEDG